MSYRPPSLRNLPAATASPVAPAAPMTPVPSKTTPQSKGTYVPPALRKALPPKQLEADDLTNKNLFPTLGKKDASAATAATTLNFKQKVDEAIERERQLLAHERELEEGDPLDPEVLKKMSDERVKSLGYAIYRFPGPSPAERREWCIDYNAMLEEDEAYVRATEF